MSAYRPVMAGGYVALALTALVIMGSPGPATISLTATGAAFGIRRSLAYLAGIVIGTWLVLVAVATGLTAVLLSAPGVRPVLLGLSAAYLLWLAYHLATAPPLSAPAADRAPSSTWGGLLLGVANPKAWVAIAAVFAGSRLTGGGAGQAVAKTLVLAAMVILINTVWLAAGASLAPLLHDPRRSRVVNVALAALLVAATALALVE
jgi:threonine/homoserine/homoserine lactone efflux protein